MIGVFNTPTKTKAYFCRQMPDKFCKVKKACINIAKKLSTPKILSQWQKK